MKNWLTIALFILGSVALADSGKLTLSPAVRLERGLAVGTNQAIQIRVTSHAIRDQTTAIINVTRAGRAVGDFPLRRDGDQWTTTLKLELPGPQVLTVRMFDKTRVWASAVDLTALRPESPDVPRAGEATEDLEFTVTSGKAGADTSGWLGVAPLLVLIGAVAFGTQAFRKRPALKKPQTPS